MYSTRVSLRVRYAETDQMDTVYYGHYATYYEVSRVEALRQLNFSYKDLEKTGVIMPVYEYHNRYLLPATYDELLTIHVSVPVPPTARIRFDYKVMNEQNTLLSEAYTLLAFLHKKSKKPTKAPIALQEAMRPFFHKNIGPT